MLFTYISIACCLLCINCMLVGRGSVSCNLMSSAVNWKTALTTFFLQMLDNVVLSPTLFVAIHKCRLHWLLGVNGRELSSTPGSCALVCMGPGASDCPSACYCLLLRHIPSLVKAEDSRVSLNSTTSPLSVSSYFPSITSSWGTCHSAKVVTGIRSGEIAVIKPARPMLMASLKSLPCVSAPDLTRPHKGLQHLTAP